MKIYISGKIGRPIDEEIKDKFYKAYFALMEKHGLTPDDIVNPASDSYQYDLKRMLDSWKENDIILGRNFDEYKETLLYDMAKIRQCNAIYMLKDWTTSLGARAEHSFALAGGLEVMYEEEPIDTSMKECIDELICETERWGAGKITYTMTKIYGKWDVTVIVENTRKEKGKES